MSSEDNEKLMLVALQIISQSIIRLPLAIAQNLTTARGSAAPSGSSSGLADAMKKAASGTAWNPYLPPPPPPPPPSRIEKVGSGAKSAADFAADNQLSRTLGNGARMVTEGLSARFATLLGPMQLLNQVVASNTSGFQVLGSATKVLAATLGPVLLPVTTVFAATIVRVSDVLWAKLMPNLEKFDRFVLGQLVPAGEALVGLFGKLGSAIEWVARKTGTDDKSGPGGLPGALVNLNKGIDKLASGDIRGGAANLADASLESIRQFDLLDIEGQVSDFFGTKKFTFSGDTSNTAAGLGGLTGVFGKVAGNVGSATGTAIDSGAAGGGFSGAMRDTLKELRLSLGTKAQFSGLGDVGRNAQLAALNQSPFETKILERMDKVISALERAAEPERTPVYSDRG